MALDKIKINDTTTVNTGVVYDITKATGQSYADLKAALSTNGNNVPLEIREGGMTIRFVSNSNNTYKQYRCISDDFTTNVTKWISDENIVTKPSGNTSDLEFSDKNNNVLVRFKNGGIKTKKFDSDTTPIIDDCESDDLTISDNSGNDLVKFGGGHIRTKNFNSKEILQSDFIGIASACRYDGKLMHISFDDTNNCLTTLFGSSHSSIYDVTFFANLKTLHETYGACFSCYVYANALESVTNAYASEFQAAKNWLKFNFHSLSASKTYGVGTPIIDDYNLGISRLLTMVGNDIDCLDHQMRANYWELSLANAIAVRDNQLHASYIFCTKDPFSPSSGNYYLNTKQKKVVFANSLYFDVFNEVIFIQTCARLDDDDKISDSKNFIAANVKWQKTCEVLNHEWGFNVTKMGNFLDWAKNTMGFKFGFFSDIFVIK